MEEDVGVKGTVTRLRRRLSVEKPDDVSSPSTPTKKRGGRLAAKPQLELINENAQVSSPKKTRRKSLADSEEKPVTPSRRSTRIKSNTSIVSETVTTDSPRARRALRRTSQAGSDNEGPATPARQTRRTRKDSASSVENQEPVPSKPSQVIEMVIAEEPEIETANKSKSSPQAVAEELSPNSARKSKRLLEKRNRRSGSYKSDHDLSTNLAENISEKDNSELKTKAKLIDRLNKSGESKEYSEQLSESNISLLKSLDAEHKIKISNHNKSTSSLSDKKKKRNRTESWPVVLTSPANDNIMFSDNEQSKKKRGNSGSHYSWISNSGSSLSTTNVKEDKTKTTHADNDDVQTLESPTKRNKRKTETSISKEEEKPSAPDQLSEINTKEQSSTKNANQKSDHKDVTHHIKNSSDNTDNASLKSENNEIPSELAKFFGKSPSNVQAVLYFEDSDSNSASIPAKNTQQLDNEDQCVPVVKHDIKLQEKPSPTNLIQNEQENIFAPKPIVEKEACDDINNSCEPMDIDETIHEEIMQKSQHSLQTSIVERKSLSQRNSISEEPNKSKRKSSISVNDTSKMENKSTLILSQLKDVSKTSDNIQSPKTLKNELLSKSTAEVHENTKKVAKDNLSLNDLKGTTPLKQITVQKLNMQTSTPIATQQIEKTLKTDEKNTSLKSNSSNFSKSIDESQCEEESDEESYEKSKFIDDEAEEASDDYESGDSRDEEERRYDDEHEIVEQGETLGSDEDFANDSDYEKDSFIVSSDAEDDELLSGSGDDLSMSDKELSMSKKSKKKYNERKLKEQKNASREMFQSRHNLNTSEKKSPALKTSKTKSNRMRLDSSLLKSDEEIVVKPNKNKRLRLDSTLDTSNKNDDVNDSLNNSNKKSKNKSLPLSDCDKNAINEKEITIVNENVSDNNDPLQVQFKQEPKTPQKDLDMSVVQFTSRQDIENVEVCEGKSILNQTGKDPLQDTIADDNTSDSSENEEIIQNYDSVLDNLNKNKKGKLNSNNLSLKLDKKSRNSKNEPILAELNLTHTKRSKKNSKQLSHDVVDSKTSDIAKDKRNSDCPSDSSSIDLKLLFSEDNCESGDDSSTNKEKSKEEETFVSLRKSTGKTNIGESGDDLFFIDTTGAQDHEKDHDEGDAPVEVLFTSKNKKKKDKLDTSLNKTEVNENMQPVETASAKKKKQKKRHSAVSDHSGEGTNIMEDISSRQSYLNTGKAQNSVVEAIYDDDSDGAPVETPYKSEKASDLHGEILKPENTPPAENGSSKKKKKKKNKKKKQSADLDESVLKDVDSAGAPKETPYEVDKNTYQEANLQESETTEPAELGSGKKKKKKKKQASEHADDSSLVEQNSSLNSNKRKRKSSNTAQTQDSAEEGAQESIENEALNESSSRQKKKKRKISQEVVAIDETDVQAEGGKKKKKNLEINFQNIIQETETGQTQIKKNKKRKERDEDMDSKNTKVSKASSLDEVHMPPLPDNILSQLDDTPRKITGESKVISTSKFVVENARQKRAKPSKYLEESIYLDANSPLAKKDKSRMKKPKVLPFIPTASISDSGFTTNFQIKKISQNIEFVAGPAEMTFSKETYLQKKGIKKLGTYDRYKKQMSRKLSKF